VDLDFELTTGKGKHVAFKQKVQLEWQTYSIVEIKLPTVPIASYSGQKDFINAWYSTLDFLSQFLSIAGVLGPRRGPL